MEDYAAKMQLKSDAALREYVASYAQYRDEAVLAALAELRHRGQPAPEEVALRPLLEAAVQQEATQTAQQRESAAAAEQQTEVFAGPALYTPGVIVLFSLMFHFLSGAVLLALNFRTLKRSYAIWGLAAFVVLYFGGELVLRGWLIAQYGPGAFNQLVAAALNLPVIIAYLLWFWPRYIGQGAYRPRGWLVPLFICFGLALVQGAYLVYTNQVPHLSHLPQPH